MDLTALSLDDFGKLALPAMAFLLTLMTYFVKNATRKVGDAAESAKVRNEEQAALARSQLAIYGLTEVTTEQRRKLSEVEKQAESHRARASSTRTLLREKETALADCEAKLRELEAKIGDRIDQMDAEGTSSLRATRDQMAREFISLRTEVDSLKHEMARHHRFVDRYRSDPEMQAVGNEEPTTVANAQSRKERE